MRRVFFALIERVTDPLLSDSIAGDLEEERQRRACRSPAVAAVWFWRELLAIAVRASAARLRGALSTGRSLSLMPRRHEYRHGMRVLRNHPWYSATAIGVIALSMTLATTVFGVVAEVLFPQLPYDRPQELYRVSAKWSDEAIARTGGRFRNSRGGGPLSLRDVRDLADTVPGIRIVAYRGADGRHLPGTIGPWRPIVASVGPQFLEVLGVRPILGGLATADYENAAGTAAAALVTHDVWQSQFGGRLDIVGAEYVPDPSDSSERYRIAGVLPDGFVYPADGSEPDFLTPLVVPSSERGDRRKRSYDVVARLPPGQALVAWQARFTAVAHAGLQDLPDDGVNGGAGHADVAALQPLSEWLGLNSRERARQLLAVALVLVMLGCINVSGLVATRGIDRARELALRRALGAGVRDVAAVVFAECAVLVGIGSLLGVALAGPMLTLVVRVMPAGVAPTDVPGIDWRVLLFAGLISALAIAVVSIWPLVRSLRQDARPALADGGHVMTSTRSRGRLAAVALQVAMGMILTAIGAFVVGSLAQAMGSDLGFPSDHLVILEGTYPPGMPATRSDQDRLERVTTLRRTGAREIDDLLARVRARSGVVSAGATHATILRQRGSGSGYGDNYAITEGFVEALRPRLVAGRWPTPAEILQGARVAVVSEDIARRFLGGGSPIGQTIRDYSRTSGVMEVIGVSESARFRSWDSSAGESGQVFSPYRATAVDYTFTVVVRVTDPRDVLTWAMSEARTPVGSLRLTSAALADDMILDTVRVRQFQSWVFGTFSTASLAIVGVGILGLAAMTSARRQREIGIRLTLGATRPRIVRQLLREQLASIVVGILFGVAGGFVGAALLERSYVYGVLPWDARVWTAAIATVLATATIGMLIPARRASRVDPVAALRCE